MKLKVLTLTTVMAVGVLFPSIAHALQWVKVGVANDQSTQVYVDRDSVKRRGNTVKLWTYFVFRQPAANGMTALKMFEEVNCSTGNYRIFRETVYVNGLVRSDTKGDETIAIAPGTLAETVFQSVCQR